LAVGLHPNPLGELTAVPRAGLRGGPSEVGREGERDGKVREERTELIAYCKQIVFTD